MVVPQANNYSASVARAHLLSSPINTPSGLPAYRAYRCTDDDTLATIKRVHADTGMLIDPHTAIGVAAAEACKEPGTPVITLATAHPAKFPDAVERATGVRPPLPEHVADLFERPERTVSLPNDLRAVEDFVAAHHSA